MHTKRIAVIITALLFLAYLCCSCASAPQAVSANDGCEFAPYKPQNKAKKTVVHPAPGTPIGGNYTQY